MIIIFALTHLSIKILTWHKQQASTV